MLRRIVQRLARLCPPRHRELVRGMVAELDAIGDPAERTLFALGAIAAVARLAVSGHRRPTFHAPTHLVDLTEPADGASDKGAGMSNPTAPRLLRRHVVPFVVSLASLTTLLLARHAAQWVPRLSAGGASATQIAEVLLLSLPFILALTIPMAVFLAVSWVFTRLGAEGVLASARRESHGVRRLLAPVLAAASVLAAVALISNTEIVPRTNARLVAVLGGAPAGQIDRTMTFGELRHAAREARIAAGADARARAAGLEVEVQKKLALAAACLVLALLAAATAIRFPRGGGGLVLGVAAVVFAGYYLVSVTGESLADRQLLSPFLAMWMADGFLLAVAVVLLRRSGGAAPGGVGALVDA